jgi:hypothetical protein
MALLKPPHLGPMPLLNAVIKSVNGLTGVPGDDVLFHQLFSFRLNLSPAITFKIIAGPIFCEPLAAFTFATLVLPGGVLDGDFYLILSA